jgi:hypothetical protein
MADLSGARHKLTRAQRHIRDFHAEGMQWLSTEVASSPTAVAKRFEASDSDPTVGRFVHYVSDLPEAPTTLSLILGDALTNLRAVLDYIAWQLAVRPPDERKVQFPITDDLRAFGGTIARQIPNIDPTHRTIVERYQPYRWPAVARDIHPFRLLNRLVGHDKHRELRMVGAFSQKMKASMNFPVDTTNFEAFDVQYDSTPYTFSPGTELLVIHGRIIDPDLAPQVKVKWTDAVVGLHVAGERVTADEVLRRIERMVTSVLDEFERIL